MTPFLTPFCHGKTCMQYRYTDRLQKVAVSII